MDEGGREREREKDHDEGRRKGMSTEDYPSSNLLFFFANSRVRDTV